MLKPMIRSNLQRPLSVAASCHQSMATSRVLDSFLFVGSDDEDHDGTHDSTHDSTTVIVD